jgi:tetratricopeptide (TPR) repeat protein
MPFVLFAFIIRSIFDSDHGRASMSTSMLKQAQTYLAQENFEKVIEITTDFLELKFSGQEKPKYGAAPDGERLLALQLRCSAYFGSRYYADALSDADILIRLMPNGFPGYYYRGVALLHFDEIEEAKEDFNRLLDLPVPPTLQAGVYHSLGLAEYIAGNYETALRQLSAGHSALSRR